MALLGRDTTVTGPFPAGVLLLETLVGTEMLATPYVFDLGLLSEDHTIDPKQVMGEPMAVGIKLATGDWRYFHGIVTSFTKSGNTHRHTRYAAKICSKLSLCDYTSDCRIFNESPQDAVSILTKVLAERDVTAVESGSIHDHPFRKREICAQYRESDLHFVQRLIEEEGIYYFFRHAQDGHTMVLADSVAAHETSPGYEHVLYTPKQREAAGAEEHLWDLTIRKALYPGQHTVAAGYDPTKKRPKQAQLGNAASGEPAPGRQFEHYDHPGGLCEPDEASNEAMLRAQADHARKNVIQAEGNTMGLGVGHLVTLLPDLDGAGEVFPFWKPEGFAKQYLIVGATYSLTIDQYETGTTASGDESFRASYVLLNSQTPFRPRRALEKPRMGGPQTALVVGPAGEEIWTDKLGRVRVQFDWDRLGEHNEKSTCWVRSADMQAGPGWGGQHVPRIGQEVLVRFLDGDPDRPIIAGSLYNKDNLPVYGLPGNATQSGIKSRSSKGGSASNFNEIRFEDKKGAEELHVQAEKDMSTLVKNNQTLHVGRNRGIVVGRNEENLVKGNRTLKVKADEKEDGSPPAVVKDSVVIGGKHDKAVTGRVLQVYGGDHRRKVDGDQELVEEKNKNEHVRQTYKLTTDKKFQLVQDTTSMTFKNQNVMLNAGGEILIMAGGATLSLERSGMTTFNSPVGINLVCGASSLSVTPAGVAIAAPNVIAAAGSGSKLAIGAEGIAMTSRQVLIEADGVCKIRGKNKLRLQESDKDKAKRSRKDGGAAGQPGSESHAILSPQKRASTGPTWYEVLLVDEVGQPVSDIAICLEVNGESRTGTTTADGYLRFREIARGDAKVRFVDPASVLDQMDKRWANDRPDDWIVPPQEAAVLEISRDAQDWRRPVPVVAEAPKVLVLEPPYWVRLLDEEGHPLTDRPFDVSVGNAKYHVTSDKDGWIQFPVGQLCPEYAIVEWRQDQVARTLRVSLQCHEGQGEDVARARLWNLGFQNEDGEEATLAFQNQMELPVLDGELSDEVTSRIDSKWTKESE